MKDETCHDCGNPIWICHNEFADNVGFKIKSSKCFAKAELEKYQEQQEKKRKNAKRYGEVEYPVAYTYDKSDMPSRMSYYMALAEQYAKAEDDV